MNKKDKLTEATMLALQGKLNEDFDYSNYKGIITNSKYGTLRHICSSGDQYFNCEPELIYDESADRFIWIDVNWDNLDYFKDYTENDIINITAEPYIEIDENGNVVPIQCSEQKDFTDYQITAEDVEYFNNKGNDIEKLLEKVAKAFYEKFNLNEKTLKAQVNVEFKPYK